MNNITDFKNNELLPRVFECMDRVFPHLHFERYKGGWGTTYQIDGTEGDTYRPDRCVVTPRFPYYVYSQSRGSRYVIDLYQEYRGGLSFIEAINELCDIVGIEKPHYNEESLEAYKEAEQRRTRLEEAAARQRTAIFTDEGKEVREYLYGRGWTDEDIMNAQLGYVSREEAAQLHNDGLAGYIGDDLKLSIPFRSGSILYGFKLRSIKDKRFINLGGTKKGEHLFNLTGINLKEEDATMIVVESELDALLMEARGIKGVVATAGGKLTDNFLDIAQKRGIKIIKLFFDNDDAGYKFTSDTIDLLYKRRIEPLVISIDERYKDAGDYLKEHTIEELNREIGNADYGGRYKLRKLWEEAEKGLKESGETFTPEKELKLRHKVIDLANSTPSDETRSYIIRFYSQSVNEDGFSNVSYEELLSYANKEREFRNTLSKEEETKKALADISKEVDRGNIDTALKIMSETAAELSKIEHKTKYSSLLSLPTEEDLIRRIRNKQGELSTNYILSNGKDKEEFTLPAGAITFICAPTSHGKSTMLQNIALQVATNKTETEGAVLYFTFEEDGDSVAVQMLNKYMNLQLCRNYSSKYSNNLRAMRHYFKAGENENKYNYIRTEQIGAFDTRRTEFMSELYATGKLRIFYEDYDSSELINAISYISSQTKVKAVFIDYIQLLSKRGNRLQRTEELKEICKELKNLAVERQLPIIVAAQLNREANSPIELHSQRIAEAADLERIANKILCLWNTSFPAQKSKDSQSELSSLQDRLGFTLGTGGKIYAKLTKNRGGVAGLEAVFDFDGNTGVITDKKYNRATEPTAEQETSKSWHDNEY